MATTAAEIQSQINACNSAGGGTVKIIPGTFIGSFNLADNVTLEGSGIGNTILKLPDNSPQYSCNIIAGQNTTLKNLTIDGNNISQTYPCNGIFTEKQKFTAENIEVENTIGIGIEIAAGATYPTLKNCWVHDSSGSDVYSLGIWIGGGDTKYAEVVNCISENNHRDGLLLHCNSVIVKGGYYNNNGLNLGYPGANGIYVEGGQDITINSVQVFSNSAVGLSITNAKNVNVSNNISEKNNAGAGISAGRAQSGLSRRTPTKR